MHNPLELGTTNHPDTRQVYLTDRDFLKFACSGRESKTGEAFIHFTYYIQSLKSNEEIAESVKQFFVDRLISLGE